MEGHGHRRARLEILALLSSSFEFRSDAFVTYRPGGQIDADFQTGLPLRNPRKEYVELIRACLFGNAAAPTQVSEKVAQEPRVADSCSHVPQRE